MTRTQIPQRIHRGEQEIVISWSDDHEGTYRARDLRLNCQCANCVDEMTRTPLLDPASVPIDVTPLSISLVGNYAIKIDWSDGHNTGIYTYERLWEMCGCDRCKGGGSSE